MEGCPERIGEEDPEGETLLRGEWEEGDREMALEILKRGTRSCRAGLNVWATGFYLERAFRTCPEIISVLERNGYEGYFSIEMFNAGLWQLPNNEAREDAFLERAIAVDEIFPWARTCRWEEDFGS